ncbi:MAG TPA: DUF5309 family protein [Armatimonadota bacterium]|nr:DUF5309 family protein [Armatimonadota bacterium]
MATGVVKSNIVSYLGELFQSARRPNTLLRLLGGFQGSIIETTAKEFPTGVFFDLRAPAQPAILEGANAPAAQHRTMSQATNVVQIFHESVDVTYLAKSDKSMGGVVPIPMGEAQGSPQNPRDEAFQVMAALATIAQDANYSFLRGVYANPADPTGTALRTRGILTAITTNIVDKSAEAAPSAATYRSWIELLVQTAVASNGYNPDGTWTLMADTTEYNNVQAAYEALPSHRQPESRSVGGLQLRQLYTRFGILNLVLEPDMPADQVALVNLGVAGVVGLPVPGKGLVFEEPLQKVGSSDKTQIYGQLGIAHGPEYAHAKLLVPAASSL